MATQLGQFLLDRFGADHLAALEKELSEAFRPLATEIQRAARMATEHGRRIGQAGWTFPMSATFAEAAEMLKEAESEPIDAVFVRYYEEDDGRNYKSLKSDLAQRAGLVRWKPLIDQAFEAYEQRLYLVVVPAMLTVVEGTIAQIGGPDTWARSTRPSRDAKRMREETVADSVNQAVWLSIEAFIESLFVYARFGDSRPRGLNRHWILHGRDQPDWNKADCLRLFQAIDAIVV